MRYEKSCGVIPFRETPEGREYLLVRSVNGGVGFPKGHMEPGETEEQTALREMEEETGLQAQMLLQLRWQTEYPLPGIAETVKTVVLFAGECLPGELKRQKAEIAAAAFLPVQEAAEKLTVPQLRQFLLQTERFLAENSIQKSRD